MRSLRFWQLIWGFTGEENRIDSFKLSCMKSKLMSMVIAAALLASCGTTTTTTTTANPAFADVPVVIQTNFKTQYPAASNITWTTHDAVAVPIDWELAGWNTMDAGDYVVRFDMENEKYYAWYDANGEWIGSAYLVKNHSMLPAAVHTTISNQYSGYAIESVQREFWKDKSAFEIKLKNGDNKVKLLVDANGQILKSKLKDD